MASTPFGTWFFNADYRGGFNPHRFWLTVTITDEQTFDQFIDGTIDANGTPELLDSLSWDAGTGKLEFRRVGDGFWQWYSGTVVEGVFVGRFSPIQQTGGRPDLRQFRSHVTGWNSTFLDQDIVPRSYDLTLPQDHHARLRIDRLREGVFVGRLKVYAVGNENEHEEPEYDLEVTHWDGQNLRFIKHYSDSTQEVYVGTAIGRNISGTSAGQPHSGSWSGVRSGILTYGLVPKTAAEQTFWQRRTRGILLHLMMPGNTVPLTSKVDRVPGEGQVPDDRRGTHRDDSPQHHPPDYRVCELSFHSTLEDPYGGPAMEREAHGFLAIPTAPAPPNGFRAVLTLNGHHGSAWEMMYPHLPYPQLSDSGAIYWYGNAFARRGYVVLALDIEHRPQNDSQPLYNDGHPDKYLGFASSTHPAIKTDEFNDSDWTEDGERAWDAMRALDFLLTLRDAPIDPTAILVTGLSMGGEISTIAAALDPRITGCIPAGFSPDLDALFYRPEKNHTCWRWMHADLRDYIDTSDLHALIAPRPLIVQTGKQDHTFSSFSPPFASDKQVARRSRAAYVSEPEMFVHYLHFDGHNYHVGDPGPGNSHAGVHVPTMIEPGSPFDLSWQTNADTTVRSPTLFDLLDTFFPI